MKYKTASDLPKAIKDLQRLMGKKAELEEFIALNSEKKENTLYLQNIKEDDLPEETKEVISEILQTGWIYDENSQYPTSIFYFDLIIKNQLFSEAKVVLNAVHNSKIPELIELNVFIDSAGDYENPLDILPVNSPYISLIGIPLNKLGWEKVKSFIEFNTQECTLELTYLEGYSLPRFAIEYWLKQDELGQFLDTQADFSWKIQSINK